MANVSKGGLRWVGSLLAPQATSPPIVIRPVASAYATVLYVGDPVILVSDGTVAAQSAVTDPPFGVFVGAEQYWDGSAIRKGGKLPVSTYGSVLERQSLARIIPCRGQIFEIDADDGTTATTLAAHQALIGENCELVAGTPVNDQSGIALDISTHAVTAALLVNLHGLGTGVDQDWASSRVKYRVVFNNFFDPGAAAAASLRVGV